VSNQLTRLLTSGNPYLERARTKALAGANRRGLLNSSMALGAGEAAAIDAALPIAQADANTFGGAERYNVDIGNTFARDANTFGRQGALAKLGGLLSQESQAQGLAGQFGLLDAQQGFTRERDASQFDNRLREIVALTAADLQRFDAQQGTNLAGDYRRSTEGLYGEYAQAVARINEADMDPNVKQAQVAELQSLYTSRQTHLNTIYSNQSRWNDEWAQFALAFGQGG
jgi:transcription termination factor Rho